MTEYTGTEAIEQLTAKLRGMADISEENLEAILSFKAFLEEQGNDVDTVIVALYGWYELLPHCDFQLKHPDDGDIQEMVEDAPAANRSMYREALTLFYKDYLPEQGVSVDRSVLDWV